MKCLLVILGGGIGALSRYLLSALATRCFGNDFAWGTLGVNLGGCLIMGFCFALAEKNILSSEARLLIMTGFLGGLTTFSSYALDSMTYWQGGLASRMLMNVFLNNVLGLALVWSGIAVGRSIIR